MKDNKKVTSYLFTGYTLAETFKKITAIKKKHKITAITINLNPVSSYIHEKDLYVTHITVNNN